MGPNDLVECYPEIMPGANEWCWSDGTADKSGTITVTDEGLKQLLRLISKMQRALFDAAMATTDAGGKLSKDGMRIPFKVGADLMNRTSEVFCEGDLIVSGLFLDAEGKPLLSLSTKVPLLGSVEQRETPAPPDEVKT